MINTRKKVFGDRWVWKVTGRNIFRQNVVRIVSSKEDAEKERRLLRSVRTKNIRLYRVRERKSDRYPSKTRRKKR